MGIRCYTGWSKLESDSNWIGHEKITSETEAAAERLLIRGAGFP